MSSGAVLGLLLLQGDLCGAAPLQTAAAHPEQPSWEPGENGEPRAALLSPQQRHFLMDACLSCL